MRLYSFAFGLSIAAATSFTTFFVPASIDFGLRPEAAGLALSTGSAIALVMRVALGHFGDRFPTQIPRVMLILIGIGSVGYGLLALGSSAVAVTFLAALLAIGIGWSWTGLLFFVATQSALGSEGSANGVLQTGGAAGGMIGPMLVGFVIDAAGFQIAWLVTLSMQTLALVFVARGSGPTRPSVAHPA
jgi:nitrate/nitrite transporter NarK